LARTRTTKKLAQRIDLDYFKRPSRFKRSLLLLSIALPTLSLLWLVWHGATHDSRVYSSGRMSAAHAVLEKDCAACHLRQAGAFSAKAADTACLACHDGPIHHANQTQSFQCATCHTEHRGRINLTATSNQSCAQCHANLQTSGVPTHYSAHIRSFENGHPEFAALRPGQRDPGTIKLNHAIHMQPIRRGPNGPSVQLTCNDCHRSAAVSAAWNYSDANYSSASAANSQSAQLLPANAATLAPPRPPSGRERMAPVNFANACASCHLLTFDQRFDAGVPHDKPEIVHAFVVNKFTEYIAAHPNETRVTRNPNRDLSGKTIPPETRQLTPQQWIVERTAEAEELLWRKTCIQCHSLKNSQPNSSPTSRKENGLPIPTVVPTNITTQWMPHAKFDHDAHRGFTCASCHEKALTSTESSEVLLPGIATCQTCHAPGADHAESRCFECHEYHDWSKRKEVAPLFTLPALNTSPR
jgi:hypothetical protein